MDRISCSISDELRLQRAFQGGGRAALHTHATARLGGKLDAVNCARMRLDQWSAESAEALRELKELVIHTGIDKPLVKTLVSE